MKRDLARLARDKFDVLIVGGGINGAFVAWDAATRGLKVALIEKRDFMSGTSSNSLKILHGGLRYLQDLRPDLIRKMVRERRAMMRIAPHLVRPVQFTVPTRGFGQRSRLAMGIALRANDFLSRDRNDELPDDLHLPRSGLLSREELQRRFPMLNGPSEIDGAAMWYDGQILNTERYGISTLLSADRAGACLANYVEALELRLENSVVSGLVAKDLVTGAEFEIRSELVINATGPWAKQLLEQSRVPIRRIDFRPSLAMNMVVHDLGLERALGVSIPAPSEAGAGANSSNSMVFLVPWRGSTIIGTFHKDNYTAEDVSSDDWCPAELLLDQVGSWLSDGGPRAEDVRWVHRGYLPAHVGGRHRGEMHLIREGRVIDHRMDGIDGILTLLGVKFTCARYLAEQAVDRAVEVLGVKTRSCQTAEEKIDGGGLASPSAFVAEEHRRWNSAVPRETIEDLVISYGTGVTDLLVEASGKDDNPDGPQLQASEILKAQVRRAVRDEMALNLDDVVLRRLGVSVANCPSANDLVICGAIMAAELDWHATELDRQVEDASTRLRPVALGLT